MAIKRRGNASSRSQVAWIGPKPPRRAKLCIESRGLSVLEVDRAELLMGPQTDTLKAAVFAEGPQKALAFAGDLSRSAAYLIDSGVPVIAHWRTGPGFYLAAREARAAGVPCSGQVPPGLADRDWERSSPASVYFKGFDQSWADIANHILKETAAPPPKRDLNITLVDYVHPSLPANFELLVRRAFYDCVEVHLRFIKDGKSGVDVFIAHARRQQLNGETAYPLPYFVKLGDRQEVLTEYYNYREAVDPFVPFHLGPHLVPDRCNLGAMAGIIVGDFVDDSEALSSCARGGRAVPVIACLFQQSLAGWYRIASPLVPSIDDRAAREFLDRFPPPIKPDKAKTWTRRWDRARALGASRTLEQLRELYQRCPVGKVYYGPIHSDLHAGNVRIRGGDAILIDFGAHKYGPVLFDPAALEASLLIDGFTNREPKETDPSQPASPQTVNGWLRDFEELYKGDLFVPSPNSPLPINPACWLFSAVRAIRRHARDFEAEPRQYAAALASSLLVKATKDLGAAEPESTRRAVAFLLAEHVLVHHFDGPGVGARP